MRTKNNDPIKKKPTRVMTPEQAKAAKASYKATTGMEYKPKAKTSTVAPRQFGSAAEKKAWFAKNAPERMNKPKKK
jgi:hypothetical protein